MPRRFGQLEKLPSGRYRARYTGPDGNLYKAPKTFHFRGDAEAWLTEQYKLIALNAWTPPGGNDEHHYTVGQWIEQWLELRTHGTHPLKPSTLASYQETLGRRVLHVTGPASRLRDIRLDKLTRRDVAAWWDAINTQFDSPPYNRSAYVRLKTAMRAAVDRELIPTNPVDVPEARPRPKPHRKQLPTTEVMHAIVQQLDRHQPRVTGRTKIVAILTLFHGMRIGEVLALRRRDITDTGHTITVHVRGTCYRKPGVGMVRMDSPKTSAGVRDIPVFPAFHDDVRDHLARFVGDSAGAMVCTTGDGRILTDTSFRSILNRAKARAGYGEVRLTPHFGRVWLITTLAEAGMPIPAIGQMLGQVDLKTITEVYMRATDARRDAILDKVGKKLSGPGTD